MSDEYHAEQQSMQSSYDDLEFRSDVLQSANGYGPSSHAHSWANVSRQLADQQASGSGPGGPGRAEQQASWSGSSSPRRAEYQASWSGYDSPQRTEQQVSWFAARKAAGVGERLRRAGSRESLGSVSGRRWRPVDQQASWSGCSGPRRAEQTAS